MEDNKKPPLSPEMKVLLTYLKEFGFTCLIFYVFCLARTGLFTGIPEFKDFIQAGFSSVTFAIPCYIIFAIFIKKCRSPVLFLCASLAYAVYSYSSRAHGFVDISVGGMMVREFRELTPFGKLYNFFYPPTLLALFALDLFSSELIAKHIKPVLNSKGSE